MSTFLTTSRMDPALALRIEGFVHAALELADDERELVVSVTIPPALALRARLARVLLAARAALHGALRSDFSASDIHRPHSRMRSATRSP